MFTAISTVSANGDADRRRPKWATCPQIRNPGATYYFSVEARPSHSGPEEGGEPPTALPRTLEGAANLAHKIFSLKNLDAANLQQTGLEMVKLLS